MIYPLDRLTIRGFKSIESLESFELTSLNVLVGANGAGKSNFIEVFRLLRAMMGLPLPGLSNSSLRSYVADGGGSDGFLFGGPKETQTIDVEMRFGENGYRFKLYPTMAEELIVADEARLYTRGDSGWWELGSGHSSPRLLNERQQKGVAGGRSVASYVYESIASWAIYHFHDTSKFASMRRSETIHDVDYLRFDAANIAPFLLDLMTSNRAAYDNIVDTIRIVAPFFDDFVLRPNAGEKVRLLWTQKGSDYPLSPHHLSDGTLRFICLAAALLQPNPPSTIIVDEPELGLHPYAIGILAELLQASSKRMQVIVATQSPVLIDCLEPQNVVVVTRKNHSSEFQRLDPEELSFWIADYSLGDLWRKNIIAGGPEHE